tara:strand:+ start:2554 stop:2655 length:102 start_codon:yes stop_codon:yes gene_type:complete
MEEDKKYLEESRAELAELAARIEALQKLLDESI